MAASPCAQQCPKAASSPRPNFSALSPKWSADTFAILPFRGGDRGAFPTFGTSLKTGTRPITPTAPSREGEGPAKPCTGASTRLQPSPRGAQSRCSKVGGSGAPQRFPTDSSCQDNPSPVQPSGAMANPPVASVAVTHLSGGGDSETGIVPKGISRSLEIGSTVGGLILGDMP